MKIGILGGGLTGLVVAANLDRNFEVELLEKEDECGGLCRSLQEDGFIFDYGGAHIIFSRNQEIINYILSLLGDNCLRRRRNNKVYFKSRFIKYPFENGLSGLPLKDNFECLYYYINNKYPKPTNFKEWLYYTFGKGIAEKYLIPYNEKIWNYPTQEMSPHWVEGRIPRPPLRDIVKSSFGIETEGYTHQLHFYYPMRGGIQALIASLENKTPVIHKNFEIKKIRKTNADWLVSNGREEKKYDFLISTIPIFDLINALEDVPNEVMNSLNNLHYNSLITVMMGIDKKNLSDFTAIYFPDMHLNFHRVAFPMSFSQYVVPEGKSSLMAEVTSNPGDGIWELGDKEIIEETVGQLHLLGIIEKKTVCYANLKREKYAYIIYDLRHQNNIKIIKDYITKLKIQLCGRFAEFEYLNMDACVERGISLAKRLNKELGVGTV